MVGYWCEKTSNRLVIERLSAGFVLAMKSRESGKFLPQTERREELLKEKKRDWNQLNHV